MLQLIFNDYAANDQGVLVDGADPLLLAAGSAVFRCAGAAFLGNAFQLTGNPNGKAAQQGETWVNIPAHLYVPGHLLCLEPHQTAAGDS